MNIKDAKNEIIHTLAAYLKKDGNGVYTYPLVRQRPILLIGPPGIGKTAVMEQVAAECKVGLVAYTINASYPAECSGTSQNCHQKLRWYGN